MRSLSDVLAGAATEGLISADHAGQLESYLTRQGVGVLADVSFPASAPSLLSPPDELGDTEAPRFVRGFHDILITIGVIIALIGVTGLGSIFATLPAIIILAEILVRRQRLALPAFALTIALTNWLCGIMMIVLGDYMESWSTMAVCLAFVAPFPLVLGAFYWRYRVPLALSMLLLTLVGTAVALVLQGLGLVLGSSNVIADHRLLSVLVFFAGALGVFAIAMCYDLSDPQRVTRRSDIAFWLHLGAAPVLLYSMLSFVFLNEVADNWWASGTSPARAAAVIAIVAVFMAIGLVIDRRAFVTSGLLSLGFAIWTILKQTGSGPAEYLYVTILAVGIVVLTVGIFWRHLRRAVMRLLPETVTARLHGAH
ncbi:hypothetical protein [Pararhizobium sp.]|uniref:hypothetical protein n=1 Tax=Pararhizobium sp. TaxID=1977563 RepID=UPI002727308C|nr:hypothetical protein [Pararhizobium sp.]MDO9414803.1 hypothetical protein [Pararhizobium sp.]